MIPAAPAPPPPDPAWPLQVTGLAALTARTRGSARVLVGLIDGPVVADHPLLEGADVRVLGGPATCADPSSAACLHGTFVAGILAARRGGPAPALCPGCTLLVRPVFAEGGGRGGAQTSCTPEELAEAIVECIGAGARVVNLSSALTPSATDAGKAALLQALDHAARSGVVVVAAAGNQGSVGASVLTAHPWVVPVVAYGRNGRPLSLTNVGASIGRRGVGAPGEAVVSLAAGGGTVAWDGTSAAAPFVTGAAALLLSLHPSAGGPQVRHALTAGAARTSVVPPLLDAARADRALAQPSTLAHAR